MGDVDSIREIEPMKDIEPILDQLKDKYHYTDTEISMYLAAVNKNYNGLLAWCNTGYLYNRNPISLFNKHHDDRAPIEKISNGEGSSYEVTERNDTLRAMLGIIHETQPDHFPFWQRFVGPYNCDVDVL